MSQYVYAKQISSISAVYTKKYGALNVYSFPLFNAPKL